MNSKSRAIIAAVSLCLAAIAAISASAQTKQPNLSGTWKMNLGAGRYAVTALPTDPSVPPSIALDQPVAPYPPPPKTAKESPESTADGEAFVPRDRLLIRVEA